MAQSKQVMMTKEQFEEFQKLSQMMRQINNDLHQTGAEIWYHNNEKKRTLLVESEVQTFPESTPMYRTVGRMFMRQSTESIKQYLKSKIEDCTTEIRKLEKQKTQKEAQKAEIDRNFKELIDQASSSK
ncbi:putative prefoldin subunit 1 [Blattamonas nauphoetae]|uniref:Prefoldin subunit 1 n=1 Tax=Blattamonas nauphoetae TaxID=2049346 RepID=A0ABQ9XLP6_9EUKA|nr:putative prefoldin subunit 1 [Blattamonas nauphoetae]